MLKDVISKVSKSPASKISEGALIVDMDDAKLGVAIVQKSDGASVYMTRDLAAAIHREQRMGADKAIYVVGEDQKLYFQQLFEILKRIGHPIGTRSEHVYFGMVRMEEGKMSTRKGRTILLEDVINEGFNKAREIIKERNPRLYKNTKKREKVAAQVAIGALKWSDLSADPKRPIVFKWDQALAFEGNSGPYVQYAAVRGNSILDKVGYKRKTVAKRITFETDKAYKTDTERRLIKLLASYPDALRDARAQYNPSIVANKVYEIAKEFNYFYREAPVLTAGDNNTRSSRLKLVAAASQVIENGLDILGIEVPDEM
jgi:arginyl-tRNA synthetase